MAEPPAIKCSRSLGFEDFELVADGYPEKFRIRAKVVVAAHDSALSQPTRAPIRRSPT